MQVLKPTTQVWLIDNQDSVTGFNSNISIPPYPEGFMRHNKGPNMIMFDNHVEWDSYNTLLTWGDNDRWNAYHQ